MGQKKVTPKHNECYIWFYTDILKKAAAQIFLQKDFFLLNEVIQYVYAFSHFFAEKLVSQMLHLKDFMFDLKWTLIKSFVTIITFERLFYLMN